MSEGDSITHNLYNKRTPRAVKGAPGAIYYIYDQIHPSACPAHHHLNYIEAKNQINIISAKRSRLCVCVCVQYILYPNDKSSHTPWSCIHERKKPFFKRARPLESPVPILHIHTHTHTKPHL